MPIYEFECEDCQTVEEVMQSFDDPPPVCKVHKKEMKRLLSLTKVRKGGGLYSVDKYVPEKFGDYE